MPRSAPRPRPCLPALLSCLTLALAGAARADAPFDYWVLSLSWSPSWCAAEGDSGSPGAQAQCGPGAGRGFVVHGLWPQYDQGWPEYCAATAPDPTRRDSAGMADLMGSGGLAFYQWRKHGRCSGLSGRDYYAETRAAAGAVSLPEVFDAIARPLRVPVAVIEDAFIETNPGMVRDGITVTCKSGALAEVRICLDRDLRPRRCAPDAARDCRSPQLDLPPIR